MSVDDILRVQDDFVEATKRCLAAGFEWLELHFAHGYLASEFYSPLANQRTDEYGGCFDNRVRFLLETFNAVRKVWPERLPLTVRLSVPDWDPAGVTMDESIELTNRLKIAGLDLLDVSHGFVTPDITQIPWGSGMMLPQAGQIRKEVGIPTTASWNISEPVQAETAIQNGQVDIVMLGRAMLRDPYWPFHAAKSIGVEDAGKLLPVQYERATR